MVFSSLNFLFLFLPLAVFLHLLAPKPLKNAVLLLFSIVFYAWGEPVYVVLMLLSIGINYVIGLQIGIRKENPALTRGRYETVQAKDKLYEYRRTDEGQTVSVAINMGECEVCYEAGSKIILQKGYIGGLLKAKGYCISKR